jgi:putative hydrolase of the HAD superfamily
MKYKAVVFDLFGTLVCDLVRPEYTDNLTRMAEALSAPADDFIRMWADTSLERNTGAFPSIKAAIIYICNQLGVQPEDGNVALAARFRQDYNRRVMTKPRPGAIEVISRLKKTGHKVGLISNCTPDAPTIWPETPFAPLVDVAVFSCSAGLKKPDNQIYKLAIEQLKVEARDCIFVANGQDGELQGAWEAEMYPVLIIADADREPLYRQPDDSERAFVEQKGTVIFSLDEVPGLVG